MSKSRLQSNKSIHDKPFLSCVFKIQKSSIYPHFFQAYTPQQNVDYYTVCWQWIQLHLRKKNKEKSTFTFRKSNFGLETINMLFDEVIITN